MNVDAKAVEEHARVSESVPAIEGPVWVEVTSGPEAGTYLFNRWDSGGRFVAHTIRNGDSYTASFAWRPSRDWLALRGRDRDGSGLVLFEPASGVQASGFEAGLRGWLGGRRLPG